MKTLDIIENSKNILLVAPKEIEGDNFCAALAFFYTLNNLGKNVNLFLPKILEKLKFLVTQELIESLNQGGITISINTKGNKIEKVLYEKNKKELKFNLDLKGGGVIVENISFKIRERADLIINIEKNNVFFKNKFLPIKSPLAINSPHSTICEKVTDFLKSTDENLIDANVATCLLAGMVYTTQNFQKNDINPLTLERAGYLIEKGADYQKIIQFLYKTRSFAEVKLLSIVLSKLNFSRTKSVAWCSLSEEDFTSANATSRELAFVFEALKEHFALPETIFILWEQQSPALLVKGIIYSKQKNLLERISDNFISITKNNGAIFIVKGIDAKAAENKILNNFIL